MGREKSTNGKDLWNGLHRKGLEEKSKFLQELLGFGSVIAVSLGGDYRSGSSTVHGRISRLSGRRLCRIYRQTFSCQTIVSRGISFRRRFDGRSQFVDASTVAVSLLPALPGTAAVPVRRPPAILRRRRRVRGVRRVEGDPAAGRRLPGVERRRGNGGSRRRRKPARPQPPARGGRGARRLDRTVLGADPERTRSAVRHPRDPADHQGVRRATPGPGGDQLCGQGVAYRGARTGSALLHVVHRDNRCFVGDYVPQGRAQDRQRCLMSTAANPASFLMHRFGSVAPSSQLTLTTGQIPIGSPRKFIDQIRVIKQSSSVVNR